MGKIWAVLGLSLLAGCGDSKGKNAPFREVTVVVANHGSESVYGDASDWDGDGKQKFTLAPGASVTLDVIVSYRLKVHVWRTSDSEPLFDDFWEKEDLWRMGDLVSIMVTP